MLKGHFKNHWVGGLVTATACVQLSLAQLLCWCMDSTGEASTGTRCGRKSSTPGHINGRR